jgi:hypothetical protein
MEADGSYTPPTKWIKSQRLHAPHWWPSEPANGSASGAAGFNGKNPFLKGSPDWNLTDQGKIFRENSTRAQALAAAGVTLKI